MATFYATQNECTHAEGPLCEGTLEGAIIECPWHGSKFDVRTGAVCRASGEGSAQDLSRGGGRRHRPGGSELTELRRVRREALQASLVVRQQPDLGQSQRRLPARPEILGREEDQRQPTPARSRQTAWA